MGFAQPAPIPVYEDNIARIEWVTTYSAAGNVPNPEHFAHEVIQYGHMLIGVLTTFQLADILTNIAQYAILEHVLDSS
jgi:hypothetical protein